MQHRKLIPAALIRQRAVLPPPGRPHPACSATSCLELGQGRSKTRLLLMVGQLPPLGWQLGRSWQFCHSGCSSAADGDAALDTVASARRSSVAGCAH
eukprot:8067737-Alexandrium_andersonii.AAC.1